MSEELATVFPVVASMIDSVAYWLVDDGDSGDNTPIDHDEFATWCRRTALRLPGVEGSAVTAPLVVGVRLAMSSNVVRTPRWRWSCPQALAEPAGLTIRAGSAVVDGTRPGGIR